MARSGFWGAIAWIASALYQVIVGALLFRLLGAEAFAVWALLAAARGLLLLLADGIGASVTRDTARVATSAGAAERARAGVIISLGIGSAAFVVALLGSSVPGLVLRAEQVTGTELATVIAGFEVAVSFAVAGATAILRGRNAFGPIAGSQLLMAAVGISAAVALVPELGLVGAVTSALVARLVSLVALATLVLARGGTRSSAIVVRRGPLLAVAAYAAPLWLLGLATQLGMETDLPIVGWLFGPARAGEFAAATTITTAAAALLFAVIDTAFYRLASATGTAAIALTRSLVVTSSTLAGLGFTLLVVLSPQLLSIWLGAAPDLTVQVVAIYSIAWAINAPTHALVLRVMAEGGQQVFLPFVAAEAVVSLALGLAFAVLFGPVGPAIGSASTIAVSNGVLIPWVVAPLVGVGPRSFARSAAASMTLGIVTALLIGGVAEFLGGSSVLSVLVAAPPAAAVAIAVLRRRSSMGHELKRLRGLVGHRGFELLMDERRERRMVRGILGEARKAPIIWTRTSPPLVTVRIPTYNRGQLIAERAIASALAQTHTNVEVLVIGDRCDPATEAAVLSVADRRVRFENLPQRGAYPEQPTRRWLVAGAAPCNRALELARGDWIAPLDDDDEFSPDHIEVLLDACRSRSLEFAYGIASMEVAPDVWTEVGCWPPQMGQIVHASVLYSAVLRPMRHEIRAWRIDEPGDWNLWRRMEAAGVRMGFVDQVVCRHYLERRHAVRMPRPH